MAIQVGGTTVIDNSRNLSNVGGLKTVGGSSILGSGDIAVDGSTTYNAVGTYGIYGYTSSSTFDGGTTVSGSSFKAYKTAYRTSTPQGTWGNANGNGSSTFTESAGLGGTYRIMQHRWRGSSSDWYGVFVIRIS